VLIQQASAVDAWARLLRGHATAVRDLSAQLEAEHGLTINDYGALLCLSRADHSRMRRVDLAEELMLTASGITRLLDGLEQSGFVERAACASDRRVTYAVLTEAGRAKVQEASESHQAAVCSFFEERYTAEEIEQLTNLLARLPEAAEVSGSDCAP
jgi:DNA-binding MarR family transcriptional regulator